MAEKSRRQKDEERNYVTWKQTKVLVCFFSFMLILSGEGGSFQAEWEDYGFRKAAKMELHDLKKPYEIWMLIYAGYCAIIVGLAAKSFISESRSDQGHEAKAAKPYEQEAYLSFVLAIQEDRSLEDRPMRDIYGWICEHGVEIGGIRYRPPRSFDTWARYRRNGEKAAKPDETSDTTEKTD